MRDHVERRRLPRPHVGRGTPTSLVPGDWRAGDATTTLDDTPAGPAIMIAERRLQSGLLLGGALVLVLVLAGQLYIWINLWPIRIGIGTALLWSIPQLLLWALAVPLIQRLAGFYPLDRGSVAPRLLLHLIASACCAFLVLAVLDLSDRLLHWSRLMGAPDSLVSALPKTVLHAHIGIAIYWVVLAAHHARRHYLRANERELGASRLETQLAEAQLAALRMQLNPHFLFNTLNSIGVLMRHDVAGAERMLGQLSDLLRTTLLHSAEHEVELGTELASLRSYLSIEQIRFGDRLVASIDVEPELERCLVPQLILQPLVENAIRHGIAPRGTGGRVSVLARERPEGLEIVVRDDGRGLGAAPTPGGHGMGVANVASRLERMYGAAGRFTLAAATGGGVQATLLIPIRRDAEPTGPDRSEHAAARADR